MTGWARFFLLIACCFGVLILWPQYDTEGLLFISMAFILWTCIIILLSVLSNIFGIYKFEWLNRLFSIAFLGALIYSLLYYFPLPDKTTPAQRLQKNIWPTVQDVQDGAKRLTFNFDFVRRNAKSDANFINQKLDNAAEKTEKMKKTLQKKKEAFEVIVENWEGEEEK